MRLTVPAAPIVLLASLTLVNLWLDAPALAETNPLCSGEMAQPHKVGNFDFETNSRLEEHASVSQYKFAIVSCVGNHDQVYPVRVNWPVAHITSWVPAGKKVESAPILQVSNDARQLEGCLEYGNRGDTTHAFSFGDGFSKSIVESEGEQGCRAAIATHSAPSKGVMEKFRFRIQIFFPSDVKSPGATLIQLDGEVGIDADKENHYRSVFNYEVRPYKDSKPGTLESISIRPFFKGVDDSLYSAFMKHNPEPIRLQQKGTITFEVSGIKQPALTYARYEIFSQQNELIGAVELPVYVSSSASLAAKRQ
ncbi:hypothetical protein [Pseudomonas sp. GZD-209]|uniref:hypothetical protein n=1 Tax=Pseudomonas sp. GZD-209 TaxID=3404807 RepID=UPI003BB535DF